MPTDSRPLTTVNRELKTAHGLPLFRHGSPTEKIPDAVPFPLLGASVMPRVPPLVLICFERIFPRAGQEKPYTLPHFPS